MTSSIRRSPLVICLILACILTITQVDLLPRTKEIYHIRIRKEASAAEMQRSPSHGQLRTPTQSMFFLYLVVGKGHPSVQWRKLSSHANVFVMFSSWQDNVTAQYEDACHLDVIYYPNSTWTSARNNLYSQVSELEKEKAIKFDYIMFADEDISLYLYTTRQATQAEKNLKGTVPGLLHLHGLLQRDKPARASAEYANNPNYPITMFSARCVQSCSFDGLLDIYHRTIAQFLLPYETKFDQWNWYLSMYIMNLRTRALAEPYCNLYREVFLDADTNSHDSNYPKNYAFWDKGYDHAAKCVRRGNLSLSPGFKKETRQQTSQLAALRPPPNSTTQNCVKMPATHVDYSTTLAGKLRAWPRTCSL